MAPDAALTLPVSMLGNTGTAGACPKLPALAESPPYVPVKVTSPIEEPVTVTEHHPPDKVQEDAENVTLPEPLCVQLTVPAGPEPVTVAVHVLDEPTVTLDGLQFTAVVVDDITVKRADEITAPDAGSLTTTRPVLPLTVRVVEAGMFPEESGVNWWVEEHAVGELATPDLKQ